MSDDLDLDATMTNLIVEFIVPHYFTSLLEWTDGLGAHVYFKDGEHVVGALYRVEDRDNLIEVRYDYHGEQFTRTDIENVDRIVVL